MDVEKGKYTCQLVSEPSRSKTEITIPDNALVFHGCKDTSLLDIVKSSLTQSGQKNKSVVDKKK